jgi:formiminotetrahydrofolate cyclodeaminase
VEDQTIGAWLDALASAAPAPGGGAAAAVNAAIGAALIEMVCRLTIGRPRYARHQPAMSEALTRAGALRSHALRLAADDASAYGAVVHAHALPKGTDAERRERAEQTRRALLGATLVSLDTADTAGEIVALAGRVVDGANVNARADLAAAAASARAALETALLNVEVNLTALTDPSAGGELAARRGRASALLPAAEETITRIRRTIASR